MKKEFEKVEAFDYSMPSLVISASGENDITKDDIRWYRNLENRIAKEQRKLSRMQYGCMRKQETGGMISFISSQEESHLLLMLS